MTWFSNVAGGAFSSMTGLDLLLQLALKSTLILSIGLLITRMAKRKSAATRHLIWMLVFVAIALSPVLTRVWPLEPVLIGEHAVPSNPTELDTGNGTDTIPEFIVEQLQLTEADASHVDSTAGGAEMPVSSDVSRKRSSSSQGPQLAITNATSASLSSRLSAWTSLLIGSWALGAIVLTSLWGIGQLEFRKRCRRFRPVTDDRLLTALRTISDKLGLTRGVALYQSDQESIPMTWGVLAPSIWVPSSATSWSDERLRMVLLHELAHVRRLDCLWQAIALVSVAVHWFNPLAWFAVIRMSHESEQACDDVVLASGESGSDYAVQLLDISTGGRRGVLAMCAGLAMARSHRLTGRVQAIVDAERNRHPISRLTFGVCVAAAVILAVPVTVFTNLSFEAQAAEVESPESFPATQNHAHTQELQQHTAVLPDGSTFDLTTTHQPFVVAAIRLAESASVEIEGVSPAIPAEHVALKLYEPVRIKHDRDQPDVQATEIIIGTQKALGPDHILVRTGKMLRVFGKYQMKDWVAFRSELARLQHHSSKEIARESGVWSKPINGLAACLNVDPKVGVLLELRNRSDADRMIIPINDDRLDFRMFDSTGSERTELLAPSETSFGQISEIQMPFESPLKISPDSSVGVVRWSDTGVMLVFDNPDWLSRNNNNHAYSLGATLAAPPTSSHEAWHGTLNVPPVRVRFIRHEEQAADPIDLRRYSIREATGLALAETLKSVFPQRASLTFEFSNNTNELVVRGPTSQQEIAGLFIDALNSADVVTESTSAPRNATPENQERDASVADTPAELRSRIYSFDPELGKSSLTLVADESSLPGYQFLGAPAMSHDGNWVLFDATRGMTFSQTHLVKVAVAGPDKGKVVDLGYGVCGSFSPDDTRIAFFLNNNVPSGEERGIWVMDANGTNRHRVTNGCHPHWSPDGKSLLTVTSFRSPRQLTLVEVATGKRTRLLKNEIVLGQPTWSPDGEQIAITVQDKDDRILCLVKPERESTRQSELWRQPSSEQYDETWPDWSPDGKSIVFTVWDHDAGGVLIADVPADPEDQPQRADTIPQPTSIRDCQWTADGKRILFASDSEAIHELATAL